MQWHPLLSDGEPRLLHQSRSWVRGVFFNVYYYNRLFPCMMVCECVFPPHLIFNRWSTALVVPPNITTVKITIISVVLNTIWTGSNNKKKRDAILTFEKQSAVQIWKTKCSSKKRGNIRKPNFFPHTWFSELFAYFNARAKAMAPLSPAHMRANCMFAARRRPCRFPYFGKKSKAVVGERKKKKQDENK